MILSHKHKFIFIKTRKTAGTSLEIALSAICGSEDIITPISPQDEKVREELGFPGPQNFELPLHKRKGKWLSYAFKGDKAGFYNHMSASEVIEKVGIDIWQSYYTFCVERNPWDKMLSWYHWKNRNGDFPSLKAFLTSSHKEGLSAISQYKKGDQVLVDEVFKYEYLSEALTTISNKLDLKSPLKLPEYRAKGNFRKDRRHYKEVLSPEEAETIRSIFEDEIALLGYTY